MADYVLRKHTLHDCAIGQHRNHRFGTLHRFLGSREGAATIGLGLRQRHLAEIECTHLVPGRDEIGGHSAAHIAKAYEGDFHVLPSRLREGPGVGLTPVRLRRVSPTPSPSRKREGNLVNALSISRAAS